MRKSAMGNAFTRAVLIGFFIAAGCGDDDESGSAAGAGGSVAGSSGAPVSGAGAGAGGLGGAGGSAGMAPMDAGVSCGSMTCAAGERCVMERCRRPCAGSGQCSGDACCDGYCTDTDIERDHCGGCDQACAEGLLCRAGECGEPMCAGEPGGPVDPGGDLDGGVDDDAGAVDGDPPVFGDNGCPDNESCEAEGNDAVCRCGDGAGCPPDQTCSSDGSCMCGDAEACNSGESCCGSTCFDLQTDEANCGQCGHTCRDGHQCREGVCACPGAGEKLCGDTCFDVATDENHCGDCHTQCADNATCEDGECTCDVAGRVACDGECVALGTRDNCSECGDSCEGPETCRDPSGARPLGCYCPNVNDVLCDGACVALGTEQNCGTCGDQCTAPASDCREGSCQCPVAGQSPCGGSCVDLSTGVDNDPGAGTTLTHCGACGVTCLAGATCVDGVCSCPSPSTTDMYCDEHPTTGATDGVYACIEVTTTKNCGACGNECLDDSECAETGGGDEPGDFDCDCIGDDAGKTHCPGAGCRTLSNDEQNCGACGNVCPDDATCTGGDCDCPGGANVEACMDDGEPTCVNTDTDHDHCGSCGNACTADEECCGGECVDPDTDYDEDRLNCGQCGRRCANNACPAIFPVLDCQCNNGVCET